MYVERFVTVHNLLFCAHTLCFSCVTNTLLLDCSSQLSSVGSTEVVILFRLVPFTWWFITSAGSELISYSWSLLCILKVTKLLLPNMLQNENQHFGPHKKYPLRSIVFAEEKIENLIDLMPKYWLNYFNYYSQTNSIILCSAPEMDIVNRFVDWVYCSVPVCSNLSVLGNCCYLCGGLSVACLVTFWPPIDRQSVSGALLHETLISDVGDHLTWFCVVKKYVVESP